MRNAILVLCIGCTSASGTIAVPEQNDLGAVEFQVARGDTFELRAFDAAGKQVAFVSRGAHDDGTEVVVDASSARTTMTTRATGLVMIETQDASTEQLLLLPSVSSVLEREAQLLIHATHRLEAAYTAYSCDPNDLLVSPTAAQCCSTDYQSTRFLNTYVSRVMLRLRSPTGGVCKNANGSTGCGGTSCFYGPSGFNVAQSYSYSASDNPRIEDSGGTCGVYYYGSPQWPIFDDVNGTQERNMNCCMDGSGRPCDGPNIACSSCANGNPNYSANYYWDY